MFFVGIDPSTSATGVVVLEDDNPKPKFTGVLKSKLTGLQRVTELRDGVIGNVAEHVNGCPVRVCIEGYGYATPRIVPLVELGTALRLALMSRGWRYIEAAPLQVHAAVEFKKPKGLKKIKANASKLKPHAHVEKLWGFTHDSGDVVDAYIMAQIARAHAAKAGTVMTAAMRDVVLGCRNGATSR